MLDDGLYASLEKFENFFGQQFLLQYLGGQETEETAPTVRSLLAAATGVINSSLQRGGYRVPVLEGDVDAAVRTQTIEMLATHCCVLAGRLLAANTVNLPATLKTLGDASDAWLKAVEGRSTDLLGVARPASGITPQATASVAFVDSGERTFPRGYHRRATWVG